MQSFEAVDQNQNNPMRSHFLSQIPPAKPVTAQKTGSRNPFSNTGQNVGGSQPTQSQSGSNDNNGPTLNSLAFNAFNLQQQQQQQQQQPKQPKEPKEPKEQQQQQRSPPRPQVSKTRKAKPAHIQTTSPPGHTRSISQLPELGPPLSPIRI